MRFPGSVRAVGAAAYPWLLAVVLAIFVWQTVVARRNQTAPALPLGGPEELVCDTITHEVMLGQLPEASGMAISRRSPGVLWSMNDSDGPMVVGFDTTGKMLGRVKITGADVNNWEDISIGPCDEGSCLYVADTGNGGGTQRNDVVIYRVPEPSITDQQTAPARVFNAAYPADEDHEAEAVFMAGGQLYLVTKGHPSLVFRFPKQQEPGTLATLERIGEVPTERFLPTTLKRQTRITDAETSPNGKWVAMRTNKALLLYRTEDVVAGRFDNFWHVDLNALDEPQGEGVAMSDEGDVYLASEGGGHGLPGMYAHLRCQLPEDKGTR